MGVLHRERVKCIADVRNTCCHEDETDGRLQPPRHRLRWRSGKAGAGSVALLLVGPELEPGMLAWLGRLLDRLLGLATACSGVRWKRVV